MSNQRFAVFFLIPWLHLPAFFAINIFWILLEHRCVEKENKTAKHTVYALYEANSEFNSFVRNKVLCSECRQSVATLFSSSLRGGVLYPGQRRGIFFFFFNEQRLRETFDCDTIALTLFNIFNDRTIYLA